MTVTLITGTSTGIGFETAKILAQSGHRVFATMRNLAKADKLQALARNENLDITVVELDVTSTESVEKAVKHVLDASDRIDVLINNAGISGASPLEIVSDEDHRSIFETNYWGTIRTMKAVIPSMRQQQSGMIVNVSSMLGRIAVANQIPYTASKFAVEAASEALAMELRSFGIKVVLVEPGFTQTEIFNNSADKILFDKTSPYAHIMYGNGKMYQYGLMNPGTAAGVADVIKTIIADKNPKLRYPVGKDAQDFIRARHCVSDEDWISLGETMSKEEFKTRFSEVFGVQLT